MNFLPSLSAWPFAVAGLACAAGPLIIHLLNRRRFRTLPWAAMEFLREALQRNRRIMEIRDLALLLLRTLAVLLFGFALARPFISSDSLAMWTVVFPSVLGAVLCGVIATALWQHRLVRFGAIAAALLMVLLAGGGVAREIARAEQSPNGLLEAGQPLHAVLLVDNSLSMGRQAFAGNLLDAARQRAAEFIERLPSGSRISIVPLCGSETPFSIDPHRTKDDALDALSRIDVVDRSTTMQRALNEAARAAELSTDLPHRFVLLTDQQASNWNGFTPPGRDDPQIDMQIVELTPESSENTWIADLRIEDGLADVETPATITVKLGYAGLRQRRSLQVALAIDDAEVASKAVDLEAGEGAREVTFQYAFNTYRPEPGRPAFVPIKASITPDQLTADDERHLVAHVVAALPVVFIDEVRDDRESSLTNTFGETKVLRRLLAPVTSRQQSDRNLVAVRHATPQEVTRELLEDARLVVVAGVEEPGELVPLLRQYVEQGGQLLIAAGGAFDPSQWNEKAWLAGAGVLPAPLEPAFVGALAGEAVSEVRVLTLTYDSMAGHYYFDIPGEGEQELRALYDEAIFFKAAQADVSDEVVESFQAAEADRIEQLYAKAAAEGDLSRQRAQAASSSAAAAIGDPIGVEDDASWLLWTSPEAGLDAALLPADDEQRASEISQLAAMSSPRVLARFTGDERLPYLVERRIGAGRVLFASGGFSPRWTTLSRTGTLAVFDRILRSMVQSTLPRRTLPPQERITLPIPGGGGVIATLERPGREDDLEVLDVGFIGTRQRGVAITNALSRGVYRVRTEAADQSADTTSSSSAEIVLAVNGDEQESNLTPLTPEGFAQHTSGSALVRVGEGETISLAGGKVRGQDAWWYLVLAVLVFLLVELLILAWPRLSAQFVSGAASVGNP
ncbi:MAG: BatA domain-containing protein [Pirellulaceae bacterium]